MHLGFQQRFVLHEIDSDAGAHFEAKHYPMSPPDAIEAILCRMEQQGFKPKDLEPMIEQMNRVYKVLNRKRKLTMAMVWRLHIGLGIPAESLIRQPG